MTKIDTREEIPSIIKKHLPVAKHKYRQAKELPADLVEGLIRNEDAAFDRLYVHFSRPLFDFLNALVHDETEAENIMHDTFMYILEKRDTIDFSRSIKGLLYTCSKNNAIDFFRKRRREEKYQSEPLYDSYVVDAHDQALVAEETALLIEMTICSMPPKRRQIFEMQRKDGKSNKEIAIELGIAESTVSEHLSAAKNDIRQMLQFVIFFLMG